MIGSSRVQTIFIDEIPPTISALIQIHAERISTEAGNNFFFFFAETNSVW